MTRKKPCPGVQVPDLPVHSKPMKKIHFFALLTGVFAALSGPSFAQQTAEDQQPVHWGYSAFFGTGWYQIDDSRSVFVLRIAPRQVVRESHFEGREDRKIGIEIHWTATVGLHDIDDLPNLIDPENFGTFTFTPGLELEIPVTENFYLRPYAKAGWGSEFSGDYSAWMWYGGLKSRYRFPGSKNDFALIGNIYYAGFKPDEGDADDLSGLLFGVEGSIPVGQRKYRNHSLDLDWHVNYSYFTNEPVFSVPGKDPYRLSEVYEAGLALSPRGRKWDLWLWHPDRLGLAYKYDPSGEFSAITINFSSWFYR
jgi:hypothetical protein